MSELRALARTPTQPGLEVVPDGQDGPQADLPEKEAVQQQWSAQQPEKEVVEPLTGPDMQSLLPTRGSHGRRRLCGLRGKVFWILMLVIALLVAVGLGVGLGVGFGLSSGPEEAKANMPESRPTTTTATTAATSQDSPDAAETSASAVAKALRIGGSLDRSYFSQEGVWNGSGIACNWQSFASNYGDAPEDGESPVVYYQHRGGAIRWMRYTTKGEWARGSSDSEIVASDAKNSTPISAVSYDVAGIQHRHIFYIDQNYQVRQRSGSNATTDWTDGTINQEALQTYRGDLVGLHACIDGSDTAAMRLWYASDDTTFEEYAFTNDAWAWQRSWRNYSGAAGVGCYSWGTDNYTYASFVNLDNTLELWYKEKTDMDPNGWHQTDVLIPDIHPASSISLSNHFLVAQKLATQELQVSKMRWSGKDTSRDYDRAYSLEGVTRSVPGTHLAATARFAGGVDTAFVYTQVHGDDITEFSRALDGAGGGWRRRDTAGEIRD